MPSRSLNTVCLLLVLSGVVGAAEPDWLRGWIGYNEHRTNLTGGRQANVSTNRAMIVKTDGTERRELAGELVNEAGAWTQFAGWAPDSRTAIVLRGWESVENAQREEEHKTFRFTPEGWLVDSYLVELATKKVVNVTAVERVSFYNTGLFFWPNDPTKLGFTALIGGNSKPFRMDRDGRNKTDLTKNSNGFAYGFSSSPDGLRISYHENYQVYLANADGTLHYHPKPSPDGLSIAYGSKRNGVRNLFVMRLSDRKERALTNVLTGHAAMHAYWQPLESVQQRSDD